MSDNYILDLPKSLFDAKSEKKVIDYGCGDGSFNYKSYPLLKITSIDRRIPETIKEFPDNVKFIINNPDELKKIPCDFDLVIMNYVLEHVDKPLEAIWEAESKLLNNGMLYISIPNYRSLQDRLFRLGTLFFGSKQGPHIQKFTFINFVQLVYNNTNLKLEYFQIKDAEYTFMAKKKILKKLHRPWFFILKILKRIGIDLLKNSNYIFVFKKC